MEYRTIRTIRIILVIVFIFLAILLIVWLFRPKPKEDQNSSQQQTQQEEQVQQEQQLNTVRYIQRGNITAPEEHYRIEITISASARRVDVFKGYDKPAERSEVLTNTQASYDQFYAGLKTTGFFNTREPDVVVDAEGACPLGIQYWFVGGKDIAVPSLKSWTVSCSSKQGTFAGNRSTVHTMFTNQIPTYSKFVQGVSL
ncbi:hypothetical protein KBC85_01350 [Candidatus Saccharibacteria bacterium]|nr:hypothetical protein [Candidatus Saccharibacteria bacterium]MDQ5885404.1 hypothetical protein [Patescibacteria group bacterium]MDQ5953423.1 hypothetical protein [Patescibacteria group bacterium]MDQ5958320.1 hypothetical protein [Patescibacteria group bacterium]